MASEVIAEHVSTTLLIHSIQHLARARFLWYRIVRPAAEIRISLSALLRVHQGGRYALVQNLHRPELFGPFGGVYKFFDHSLGILDGLPLRQEVVGNSHDMTNDLRGFIPRGRLHALVKWFYKIESRETPDQCLRRELDEELREIKASSRLRIPDRLELRHVRTIEEGPKRVAGLNCLQFRILQVFDSGGASEAQAFFARLFELSGNHKKLLVANTDEIRRGRARDGRALGSHCAYLIGRKPIHPESPPI